MGARVDGYRVELRSLKRWEPYLKKHSGLPGPRANLELVQAVGDEADSDRLWRLSASADEFLALGLKLPLRQCPYDFFVEYPGWIGLDNPHLGHRALFVDE